MSLPIDLSSGLVSVYGMGDYIGVTGVKPLSESRLATDILRFGTVYQIAFDVYNVAVNDPILFREENVRCRLAYGGLPYTIVESDGIICTEIPIP